jgi:U3 small nucleolar RNA-associated protein 14
MAEIQSMEQKTSTNTMNMLTEQAFRERRDVLGKIIKSKFYRVIERVKKAQDVALQQLDDILNE